MTQAIENYVSPSLRAKLRRRTSAVWIILSTCFFAWIFLILLAPIALACDYHGISQPLYGFFSHFCHQIPSRSLHLFANPLAVCARCFGFYTGFFLAFVVFPLIWNLHETNSFRRVWLFAAMIPMAVDWSLGFFQILENTLFSRILTGAILGAACGVFIVPAIVEITFFLNEKFASRSTPETV